MGSQTQPSDLWKYLNGTYADIVASVRDTKSHEHRSQILRLLLKMWGESHFEFNTFPQLDEVLHQIVLGLITMRFLGMVLRDNGTITVQCDTLGTKTFRLTEQKPENRTSGSSAQEEKDQDAK